MYWWAYFAASSRFHKGHAVSDTKPIFTHNDLLPLFELSTYLDVVKLHGRRPF
jgi:hypothetical protein